MKHRRFLEWQQKRWLIFSNRVTRTYRKIAYGKTLNPPCILHIFLLTPYEKYPNYSNYLSLYIILLPFYPYIYIYAFIKLYYHFIYIYIFLKEECTTTGESRSVFFFSSSPSFLFFSFLYFWLTNFHEAAIFLGRGAALTWRQSEVRNKTRRTKITYLQFI